MVQYQIWKTQNRMKIYKLSFIHAVTNIVVVISYLPELMPDLFSWVKPDKLYLLPLLLFFTCLYLVLCIWVLSAMVIRSLKFKAFMLLLFSWFALVSLNGGDYIYKIGAVVVLVSISLFIFLFIRRFRNENRSSLRPD